MSTARIIARNLFSNWVGQAANLLVMFFLSPFVIHQLGLAAYGLWCALTALVGYMGVLDLGIRASTGRHVILYIGKEDHQSVDETIRTSLCFFSVMGIAFILTGSVLGWIFPSLFPKVPEEYHPLLLVLLPVMGASMLVSMIRVVFSSILSAHDRFDLARGIDLIALAVRTAGTVAVLKLGYGIVGLVFAVLGANFVGLCCVFAVAKKIYPSLKIRPLRVEPARLKELFGYGIPAAITSAAVKIIAQTDVIVVSACIGFSAAGVYTAGANLINYSATFMGQIRTTFFPPIQRALARDNMKDARWLFVKQVRLAIFFGLPLYIGLIMFGRQFLHLWLYDSQKFQEDSVTAASLVLAILATSYIFTLFRSGADSLLAAMGLIRFTSTLTIIQAIFNLIFSLFFVLFLEWGLMGVAAGTLVAQLLTSATILPWYVCRETNLSLNYFIIQIVGRGILTGTTFVGICLLIQSVTIKLSWLNFFTSIVIAVAVYFPFAIYLMLDPNERQVILSKIRLH